jgi:DNA ligase-1
MSEKYDGVRAFWNGDRMTSKYGKELICPNWYTENFPKDITLDGELWLGRGTVELLNGMLNSNGNELLWDKISFLVFDVPSSPEPYEIRARNLSNLMLPKHVNFAEIHRCRGDSYLRDSLTNILEIGGEGLMLNKPNSRYVSARVHTVLKVKVSLFIELYNFQPYRDTEAQILEILPNELYCLQ